MPPSDAALARTATRWLIFGCVAWGLSFPTAKALAMVQAEALPGAGTWFYTSATMLARFSLAAVLVLLLIGPRKILGITRREVGQGIGIGLFGGGGMLFQIDGLAHTEASTSAFLTQGTVIFIPLVKAILQRRLPTRRATLCCLLALIGVAVLSRFDWSKLTLGRGEGETLIAAFFFTGHILWLERPRYADNDALRVSLVMFLTIAALCLPLVGDQPVEVLRSLQPQAAWLCLAILIGPCTLLAFLLMNRWQRHVSATTAGLIYCLEPVFATLLAFFMPEWFSALAHIEYPNEIPSLAMLIGGGLILVANVLMLWRLSAEETPSLMNEHGI